MASAAGELVSAGTTRRRLWPSGRVLSTAAAYGILMLAAAAVLFPMYLALVNALLPREDIVTYPPELFPTDPQWRNFKGAFDATPLGRFMLNSFIQSSVIVAGQLVTSVMAAYAFAFLRFPFRNALFILFLSTLMVPWEVTIIPNYQTVRTMGGVLGGHILSIDSYQALTVPFLATGVGTFLLRQHFMTIPQEMRDAAAIDGYGHWRFLYYVVVPLSRPILAAVAVFSFLQAWNQYLWPLLVTNEDSYRTVQIGLQKLASQEIDRLNVVFAGTVIAAVPMFVLLVLFQRQIIRGLTAGAIKG
jgi:sn-glycerol 3-phosphate transport system permease protein